MTNHDGRKRRPVALDACRSSAIAPYDLKQRLTTAPRFVPMLAFKGLRSAPSALFDVGSILRRSGILCKNQIDNGRLKSSQSEVPRSS